MAGNEPTKADPRPFPEGRKHPLDPPTDLSDIREEQPVTEILYPDGRVGWLVTSYGAARQILGDSRFAMNPMHAATGDPREPIAVMEAFGPVQRGILLANDPPQHTRLRRAVAGKFTVRSVKERKAEIESIVHTCLDAIERRGPPAELVRDFALPVPSLTLCALLGVPPEDRERFEGPTAIMRNPESSVDVQAAAARTLCDYVRGVVQEKRRHPKDDFLSALGAIPDLTEDEVVGMGALLFIAGHETTANTLGLAVFALLRERWRWEELCTTPSGINNAVEELLRYLTIVPNGAFPRTAMEDVEFEGIKIKGGDVITISLSAANRDPERFVDPDVLDLDRDAAKHVAFGHGIHTCLGQHLARLELEVALAGLSQRFPTLHLIVRPEDVPTATGHRELPGVRQLPVAW